MSWSDILSYFLAGPIGLFASAHCLAAAGDDLLEIDAILTLSGILSQLTHHKKWHYDFT